MKKCISIVLYLLLSVYCYTQELSGIIKYKYMYSKEPINTFSNSKVVGETTHNYSLISYLYFSNQKSLYVYDKLDYEMEAITQYNRKRDTYGQMYLIDKTKGELYFREFIYQAVYISQEKIPVIAWQLSNEIKTIAGYVCKKATAEFRGRKYAAWYTSSIPVSIGPWKLQGLPGAILEAETEDGQVKFIVESIRIPADVQKELSLTELPDGKFVSYTEYLQAFEKERKIDELQTYTFYKTYFDELQKNGTLKLSGPAKLEKVEIPKMFTIEKYE